MSTVLQLPTGADLHYFPVESSSLGIIVCPGGSYCWLDFKTEGLEVARRLNSFGISAYVLRYHVSGWLAWATHYRLLFPSQLHPLPINDIQAAFQVLRNSSNQSLGVMGFSAGGHLALYSALSCKPDFIAAIYPVVSLTHPCTHRRSRRSLLGEYGKHKRVLCQSLSIEHRITSQYPPVFLVNCLDDPIVDYRNSVILDQALTDHHIPHRYIQYRTGGHGFGMSDTKGTPECRPWRNEFLQWLQALEQNKQVS